MIAAARAHGVACASCACRICSPSCQSVELADIQSERAQLLFAVARDLRGLLHLDWIRQQAVERRRRRPLTVLSGPATAAAAAATGDGRDVPAPVP